MLFSHPDYTNFSFTSVLVVVVTFSFVVLVGYFFKAREARNQRWFKKLRDTLHRKLPWLPTVAHIRSTTGLESGRSSKDHSD
jgi:heme/copper-type cytochrome/quinol oxidase subunit 3